MLNRKISMPSNDTSLINNNNNSIFNFVNDLKNVISNKDEKGDTSMNLPQTSIYLPVLTGDLEDEVELGFEDAGYNSSDEDDLKDFPQLLTTEDLEREFNKQNNKNSTNINKESKREILDKTINIDNEEDLNAILFDGPNPNNIQLSRKYNISTEIRVINNNEEIEIIKGDLLLIILQYLYNELNVGLIELGDNFVEERRQYFKTDFVTYISIINLFLRKKEEFFLSVLSEVMSKLNISQSLLDKTFVYFMNYSKKNKIEEIKIKEAFDKVYKAGIK
jgi:hypothetical protein